MRRFCPDCFLLVAILRSRSQLSCQGIHILHRVAGELAGVTLGTGGRNYLLLLLLSDMLCGWDPFVLFKKGVLPFWRRTALPGIAEFPQAPLHATTHAVDHLSGARDLPIPHVPPLHDGHGWPSPADDNAGATLIHHEHVLRHITGGQLHRKQGGR